MPNRILPESRKHLFDKAYNFGKGFDTGQLMHQKLEHLEKSGFEYDVVILGQGKYYRQMLVECDNSGPGGARTEYATLFGKQTIDRPTVFWNFEYQLPYLGDICGVRRMSLSGHELTAATDSSTGHWKERIVQGRRVKSPIIISQRCFMPSWLVLYHELGHVIQYYVPTEWPSKRFAHSNLTFEQMLDSNWGNRLNNIPEIEQDNLDWHERPLCREAKLPERVYYFAGELYLNNIKQIAKLNDDDLNRWFEFAENEREKRKVFENSLAVKHKRKNNLCKWCPLRKA